MSKEAIQNHWITEHDQATEAYRSGTAYRGKILSADDFQKVHDFIQLKLEKRLIEKGHQEDRFDDDAGKNYSEVLQDAINIVEPFIIEEQLLISGLEDKAEEVSTSEWLCLVILPS